jgi:methionyl-tRNA synthetase
MQSNTFYISTAINYTNGSPHFGHAYEAISADVFARYHRLLGEDVFFTTGTDEHGQKVAESAANQSKETSLALD